MADYVRKPSRGARLIATTGAVIINTRDMVTTSTGAREIQGTVVMTPALARQVADQLISLADLAEGKTPPAPVIGAQSWKGRYIQ
jgi:hypothetical protein